MSKDEGLLGTIGLAFLNFCQKTLSSLIQKPVIKREKSRKVEGESQNWVKKLKETSS